MTEPVLTLKVDVDTLRGTLEGVPGLMKLFDRHGVKATFLFSLGPDHTGRAIRRVFRRGFLGKVKRTSVLEHYGFRTLMYGTLLPGPDIGKRARAPMRDSAAAGHEVGIHTWDHVLWQDHVATKGAAWTAAQMQLAYDRFVDIFNAKPATHGAAGWQMNTAALAQLDQWQLPYASDGRVMGTDGEPYRVALSHGASSCVQMPTTLSTLDELIGVDGASAETASDQLLSYTAKHRRNQVFTLHAELEGSRLLPTLDRLLSGWKAQGYRMGTLADHYRTLEPAALPVRHFAYGTIAGRSGELMVEGTMVARSPTA